MSTWGQRFGRSISDISARAQHVVGTVAEFGTAFEGAAGRDVRIEVPGALVADVSRTTPARAQILPGVDNKALVVVGIILAASML